MAGFLPLLFFFFSIPRKVLKLPGTHLYEAGSTRGPCWSGKNVCGYVCGQCIFGDNLCGCVFSASICGSHNLCVCVCMCVLCIFGLTVFVGVCLVHIWSHSVCGCMFSSNLVTQFVWGCVFSIYSIMYVLRSQLPLSPDCSPGNGIHCRFFFTDVFMSTSFDPTPLIG